MINLGPKKSEHSIDSIDSRAIKYDHDITTDVCKQAKLQTRISLFLLLENLVSS